MIHKKETEKFWSGFSAGMIAGGVLLYGFATKKGRAWVKKLLKHAEHLDDDLEGVINVLQQNDKPVKKKKEKI